MPLRKLSLKTTPAQQGQRLDQVLADWLPSALGRPLSKAKVRKLIMAGAVYLNGKRVRIASKNILANARIEAHIDLDRLLRDSTRDDLPFELQNAQILYEDQWLIAVNKPPGLPTQPTLDEARDNLFAAVKRYLKTREKVADPYVGLHHRLDRDTSGVILFTKATEVNAKVAELFTRHLARKVYQALARRPDPAREVPGQWIIENYLGRDRSAGKRAKYMAVRSGGDYARTEFRVIERFSSGLWIEARPLTGRTHQIRVHLAENRMPILGDPLYGPPAKSPAPRLMLHAATLTFPHPIHDTEILVQSPLPQDFIGCVQALKNH